ncbi:MAG: redoxin family protein [Bacteroidaceae bacterium]|nr:redoxin family protein [Bacteroidaceae bacterium]
MKRIVSLAVSLLIVFSAVAQKTQLPAEWKKVKYAKKEVLPEAKVQQGVATIRVTVTGAKKDGDMRAIVFGFKPLNSMDDYTQSVDIPADGKVTMEIPLYIPRCVSFGINTRKMASVVIAPGETLECLIDLDQKENVFVAMKGYLAATNMQYTRVNNLINERLANAYDDFRRSGKPSEESDARIRLCLDSLQTDLNKMKLTDAAKALKNMQLANLRYITLKEKEGLSVFGEPYAPCFIAFWEKPLQGTNALNHDLLATYAALNDRPLERLNVQPDKVVDETCARIIKEHKEKLARLNEQIEGDETVFFHKLDSVAPQDFLPTLLARYKGKAVLIDIWATWCGPCRRGHQLLKPLKEELRGKDIAYVYISAPSSSIPTWQTMIQEIEGDHYFITPEQYTYILKNIYMSGGIPTYGIYDRQGKMTQTHIGFPGVDTMRKELLDALAR